MFTNKYNIVLLDIQRYIFLRFLISDNSLFIIHFDYKRSLDLNL